jgi:hypothetical protein
LTQRYSGSPAYTSYSARVAWSSCTG